MQIEEIQKYKWSISKDLKINKSPSSGVMGLEQECHINVLCDGYNEDHKEEIYIECNYGPYVTKLSKSEFFTLKSVLISNHERAVGKVLSISGVLSKGGLSIRCKKLILTPEAIERRRFQAKKMRDKRLSNLK